MTKKSKPAKKAIPVPETLVPELLVEKLLVATKMTSPAKPFRKGSKFFRIGLSMERNPYKNAKRHAQFCDGWLCAESAAEWDAVTADGLD